MKITDYQENMYRAGIGHLVFGPWDQEGTHRSSIYRSTYGLVEIDEYVYRSAPHPPLTGIRFIYHGVLTSRCWRASWGHKTLARWARELIEDVVERYNQ